MAVLCKVEKVEVLLLPLDEEDEDDVTHALQSIEDVVDHPSAVPRMISKRNNSPSLLLLIIFLRTILLYVIICFAVIVIARI